MNKIVQKIQLVLAGVSVIFFASCSEGDDDIYTQTIAGSTENLVYFNMQQPLGKVNTYPGMPVVTPLELLTPAEPVRFVMRCTQTALEDITVKLKWDNTLQPEGWNEIPGSENMLNKTEFFIPKGSSVSIDTAEIAISDADVFALGAGKFSFPFRISSISGGGVISSNMSVGFYNMDTGFTNTRAAQPSGVAIATKPTGANAWTVVATKANGSPHSITNLGNMVDNSTTTYAQTGNLTGVLPLTLDFDLKQVYTAINGLRIPTSASNYRLTGVKVYTKESGTDEWKSQGPALTFANNNNHYVSFYQSVDARYVRCEITSVQSQTNGLRITDFNIYR